MKYIKITRIDCSFDENKRVCGDDEVNKFFSHDGLVIDFNQKERTDI